MNQAEFENKCASEGYAEIVDRTMAANELKAQHAHEFDACVMVIEGEMTITRHGKPEMFGVGDVCLLAAGTVHSEHSGPGGARYLAGRRFPQAAL
jgi:quercetin dioxygenase-like cupin family protein